MRSLDSVHGSAADFKLGRLKPEEEQEFLEHLAECEECRHTLELLDLAEYGYLKNDWRGKPTVMPRKAVLMILLVVALLAAGYKFVGSKFVYHSSSVDVYVHGQTTSRQARVALQEQGQQGELLVARLPSPQPGSRYELYLLARGAAKPVPTGQYMALNTEGEGELPVPQPVSQLNAVALYSVPLLYGASSGNGSDAPVATRVAVVELNKRR